MSGVGNFTNTSSSASFGRKQTNSMLNSILYTSEQEKNAAPPAADPETASVASYSSTSGLLSKFKRQPKAEPKAPAVDANKLQEQALKSQVSEAPPRAVRAPVLYGMGRM
ncbi:hypothetical protein BGZ61DRAFT_526796 [Ilyonectria robusta]|uniref:uncharacterized protein n=1 Tax=Ilyonectria robusta TaxID=1079257 RepID=UPI001E8D235F|nr:uncharacterized protein BGZ61DRAFT_526796 [Ilyonectria robusta]KAH8735756.1 hypothetical protein BGZ61DRAFT_526796 [Ilyonectria robusta]